MVHIRHQVKSRLLPVRMLQRVRQNAKKETFRDTGVPTDLPLMSNALREINLSWHEPSTRDYSINQLMSDAKRC